MKVRFPSKYEMLLLEIGRIYTFSGSQRKYRLKTMSWVDEAAEFEDITAPLTQLGLAAVDACFGEETT